MILKVSPYNVYTFRFEVNKTGTNIDFIDTDNSDEPLCSAEVEASSSGHPATGNKRNYILLLADTDDGMGKADITHTGFNINTTGAIEYVVRDDLFDATADLIVTLYDGATRLVKIIWDCTNLDINYDNGGGETKICDITGVGGDPDFHLISIRIDIDAGVNGQFDCYVYDQDYTEQGNVTGVEFENNATTVDTLNFATEDAGEATYVIDCIGITAEGGYTQGKIQYAETDLSSYVFKCRLHNGIVPFRKRFTFISHPLKEGYFNEEDFIDIFDDSYNLEFAGYIKTKKRNREGIYVFECEGMANEVYEREYETSWSSNNTKEKIQDMCSNALKFCYESSLAATVTDWSYKYSRSCGYLLNLTRFMERDVVSIHSDGGIVSEAYNNLTATGKSWSLYDGNQNVQLIDIPGIDEIQQGYFKGNTGITSVVVQYKDGATAVRPATPSETFKKNRLKKFTDPKIQESTEANQLGDNLYNIFSSDIQFLCLYIEGEGYMEPGKTIQIQNQKQVTIAQADFMIINYVYDPKNDVYIQMILTDSIITPKEFKSKLKTTTQKINTAVQQTFENQANIGGSSNTYMEYDDDDPAAYDMTIGDFITDDAWHELDLDNHKTVPSDVIGFFARCFGRTTNAGEIMRFRATSQSNIYHVCDVHMPVANRYYQNYFPIPLDSNHKFDYYMGSNLNNATVQVLWWIRQPGM